MSLPEESQEEDDRAFDKEMAFREAAPKPGECRVGRREKVGEGGGREEGEGGGEGEGEGGAYWCVPPPSASRNWEKSIFFKKSKATSSTDTAVRHSGA